MAAEIVPSSGGRGDPTAADDARSARLSVERAAGGNRMNALIVIGLMLFALGLIGRLTWNIEPRRNETPVVDKPTNSWARS